MKRAVQLVIASLLVCSSAGAAVDTCPTPPHQVDSTIETDAKVSIGALGKIVGLDAAAKVTPITKNLFEKYPNADKVTIAQLIVSTTCQLLITSGLTGKDLADATDKLNAKVLELMIEQRSKEQENKPRTEWKTQNGNLALVNSGGPVKNLEYEVFVFVQTDLHWVNNDQSYGLNGQYGSRKPGVMVQANETAAEIFILPREDQRRVFEMVIKRVIERMKNENLMDGLSYMQDCLKIQYDDLFGGHYTDYRVDTIVASGGGHAWVDKFKFDECKEEFDKTAVYKEAYKHGGGLGQFEFWSGDDENQIENMITTDIVHQVERWKAYVANQK